MSGGGGSGSGSGGSGSAGGSGVNRFVWTKLGKIWWPGEVVDKKAFTDEMKLIFVPSKKGTVPHAIVRYFDEEGFTIVKKEAELQVHALLDDKTKSDLIQKGVEKAPADNKEKFRSDVIRVEAEVSGRSKELTSVWFDNLLEKRKEEKKKSAEVRSLFTKPEEKQRVRGQIVIAPVSRTPPQRQHSKGPSTPASTSSAAASMTPGKSGRYTCPHPGCSYSCDRFGLLQSHKVAHLSSPASSTSTPARGAGPSPLGKRSPRKSSPVKSHTPSKRGRPSKSKGRKEAKSKVPDTIKKEAILEGWSDGEEDEDDKMAVLGEEPPPTLKLFDTCTSSCVDEKSGELIKQEDEASSPGKKGKKSMDDLFQDLLRQTKPEFGWVDEQHKGINSKKEKEEPPEEVESSEVSSDEEMRDEVIMRTRTVVPEEDEVQKTIKNEEEEEKTAGSDLKEEESVDDETITTQVKKTNDEKQANKRDENGVTETIEDISKDTKVDEKLESDIEHSETEEASFERSVAESLASTEPEDNPNESSIDIDVDFPNNKAGVIETVEEKVLTSETKIPEEKEVVECPKVVSPGPPLLLKEEAMEVTQPAVTLPPVVIATATPTPTTPSSVPSSSSLPPTNSDILDSPRPPRPTAAVKPTTTTTTIASPGTGVVVGGGEMIEDNVEKGAAIVQVAAAGGSSAGGSPPVLEPEQIVHVVPVENSDGTLTYMFLSVDQSSSQPRIELQHTDQNAATLMNGNEMEALYVEKGGDPPLYASLQQQTQGEEQQFVLLQQGGNVGGDTPWTLEQLQELLQANGLAAGPAGANTSSSTSGPGGNPELGTTSGNE